MKKLLKASLIELILLITMSTTVFALNKTATITSVDGYENKVNVSGTMDGDCVAVAIRIYEGTTYVTMETKPVNNQSFSASLSVNLTKGNTYTVKVSDFDGGPVTSQDFVAKEAINDNGNTRYIIPNTGIE